MKRIAVVDVDETIARSRRLTRLFWRIGYWLLRAGLRFQKRNNELCRKLEEYDEVIVLTGRNERTMRKATDEQLQRYGLKNIVTRIIMCPEGQLKSKWKHEMFKSIQDSNQECNIDWFDDEIPRTK
jgi:hypothetical protein